MKTHVLYFLGTWTGLQSRLALLLQLSFTVQLIHSNTNLYCFFIFIQGMVVKNMSFKVGQTLTIVGVAKPDASK